MMINDKMKTLTIEHLAAYLPYGVKALDFECDKSMPIKEALYSVSKGCVMLDVRYPDWTAHEHIKLILRPLSQLTETIEHNGEKFVPLDWINENTPIKAVMCKGANGKVGLFCDNIGASHYNAWPYSLVRMLLSMHFDVFDLLQYDLAIPIPSIPQP